MPEPCTVLIASAATLAALTIGDGEILAFTDVDALRALEAITSRSPSVVALERMFASTPRGAALINRIKADPTLEQVEIRVFSADSGFPHGGGSRPSAPPLAATPAASAPVQPLDQRGTRRAPRFKVAGHVNVVVDGNQATLIDISTVGMQVVSPAVLKTNQRIRIALNDEYGDIRLRASVAWASFEISPNGPRYRAGIEFLESNANAIEAYIGRHQQS